MHNDGDTGARKYDNRAGSVNSQIFNFKKHKSSGVQSEPGSYTGPSMKNELNEFFLIRTIFSKCHCWQSPDKTDLVRIKGDSA